MNVLDKIRKLIDKQNGIGISKTLIAKYCGRNHATLDYYLKGTPATPEVLASYEQGLQKFLNDIKEIIEE